MYVNICKYTYACTCAYTHMILTVVQASVPIRCKWLSFLFPGGLTNTRRGAAITAASMHATSTAPNRVDWGATKRHGQHISHDKPYSNTAVPRRWTFEIVVHLSRVTR